MSTGKRVSHVKDLMAAFKKSRGSLSAKKTGSASHWANGVELREEMSEEMSEAVEQGNVGGMSLGAASLGEPEIDADGADELVSEWADRPASAPCQVCSKTIRLKVDGTLRAHGPANKRCGGDWR